MHLDLDLVGVGTVRHDRVRDGEVQRRRTAPIAAVPPSALLAESDTSAGTAGGLTVTPSNGNLAFGFMTSVRRGAQRGRDWCLCPWQSGAGVVLFRGDAAHSLFKSCTLQVWHKRVLRI